MGKSTRLNNIFRDMKKRCYGAYKKQYRDYGGRGITVCDEWNDRETVITSEGSSSKGWISFKEWALTHGYREDLTLDRINVNKGYSPENCRWVSRKVQNNNRRSNHYITYNGLTKTMKQWCEELNLSYYKIRSRINNYKWTAQKAFETP